MASTKPRAWKSTVTLNHDWGETRELRRIVGCTRTFFAFGDASKMARMRRLCAWAVIFLCSAAGARDAGADARLAEAQAALDEAQRLLDAGRYTEGIPQGDRALAMREAVLGENHPEVATCLDLAGELHRRHGDLFSALRGGVVDRPWPPLPGTRQEGLALQRLFPGSQLFAGPEASKERLLRLGA